MVLKIASIQFDIEFGRPEKNKQKVTHLINKAMETKPDIIVLPELWTTGYDLTRLADICDEDAQEIKTYLQNIAKKYEVHIVGGSVANKTSTGIENTLLVIDKDGNLVKEYSKLHLFKLMDEHKYLQAGSSDGLFSIENETMAGVICYDIRFPEWLRVHSSKGAKAIFVVAEWPLPRLSHWRHLLISRAIENQCYVIACNRSGADPNNVFAGHSMIIDPWGDIIAEADENEGIIYGEIDLKLVEKVRKQIPIFEDRKTDFYI